MNVGDVVVLKSGSPKMTVQKIREDDLLDCVWFFKTGEGTWVGPNSGKFTVEELTPAP